MNKIEYYSTFLFREIKIKMKGGLGHAFRSKIRNLVTLMMAINMFILIFINFHKLFSETAEFNFEAQVDPQCESPTLRRTKSERRRGSPSRSVERRKVTEDNLSFNPIQFLSVGAE